MGWIAITFAADIHTGLSWHFWFLVVGGAVYSAGALVYALKRPNPWPRHFGYHEIFHIAVILGAILHFLVIQPLIV
jgi:hemolysin III